MASAYLSFATSSLTTFEWSLDERQGGCFFRDNKWIDIQMVVNEVWVPLWGFISIPGKYINIFSKELS